MNTLTHRHTALASAQFDLADAVFVSRDWGVFLDDSLNRWEVYVDAEHRRTFVSNDTWECLDGPAEVAFTDDYVSAYRNSATHELFTIATDGPGAYGKAARRAAERQGVAVIRTPDRLIEIGERAQALAIAAAGINGAQSAYQREVFAVRHAVLAQDLARLEQELERARAALTLATCALYDPATA